MQHGIIMATFKSMPNVHIRKNSVFLYAGKVAKIDTASPAVSPKSDAQNEESVCIKSAEHFAAGVAGSELSNAN